MYIESQIFLNKNLILKKYLREHSYYYKYLNRDTKAVLNLFEMMKKDYKLTIPDKLDKVKDNLSMITNFMEIIN